MHGHFSQETESLKISLYKMASLVDEQAERVFQALETGNVELCRGVKSKDLEIDAYDNLISVQCENILALFQPVASDLRFVISSLMVNNNLERCGDILVNISQRIKKTGQHHSLIRESQIIEMGKQAKEMLKRSIDCFINKDSQSVPLIIENDDIVDRLNKEIFSFLVNKMQAEPNLIEPCSQLIVLVRHIERLADHATNIAENIAFYIDAKVIAHRKKLQETG